ncbi:hypothetical protein [Streptomyces jumonjinensis]|uniref:hypothetical protein n=1 Tax=Streptomyces jumonjinensis TaxID=1945 RepID=UPI0037A31BA9
MSERDAATSRRVRALCRQTGATPGQLLSQLAEHARPGEDGTVAVEPFTPG